MTPAELRAEIRAFRYLARSARRSGYLYARRYHVTRALENRAALRAL